MERALISCLNQGYKGPIETLRGLLPHSGVCRCVQLCDRPPPAPAFPARSFQDELEGGGGVRLSVSTSLMLP